jgi:hypothetical protein
MIVAHISKRNPKVKNRPRGENSPNLVTLPFMALYAFLPKT